jgi:hypothetical protein
MSMAQAWSLIGLLATAFGGIIFVTHRGMSYGLDGLRNEMVARFEKVDEGFEQVDKRFDRIEARLDRVESTNRDLDHDVRALNRAVLGGKTPPEK